MDSLLNQVEAEVVPGILAVDLQNSDVRNERRDVDVGQCAQLLLLIRPGKWFEFVLNLTKANGIV